MVVFDQLRISDDGLNMFIDAHVPLAMKDSQGNSLFENVFIQDLTVVEATESFENLSLDSIVDENNPKFLYYKDDFAANAQDVHLVLNVSDLVRFEAAPNMEKMNFCKKEMPNTLFFVYIRCRGAVNESEGCCVPCVLQDPVTMGVTFDENVLYQRVMDYTRELANDCTVPQGFIDFILLWNAFKSAVETEHYIPAIKFYSMLFGKSKNNSPYGGKSYVRTKGCGCHG